MKKIDHLDLDGRLLQLLAVVHEEGSVTRAAERLGVTQSGVSHMLDRLRAILGDPLFVRAGRGIVATARAEELASRARELLGQMRAFARGDAFDPAVMSTTLTVAANDLQRDLLLPAFLARVRTRAPGLRLRVIPSGAPEPRMLRDDACQLLITPRPPEGSDIVQRLLFRDRYRVFYDGGCRAAPSSLDDYLAAAHVSVVYEQRGSLEIDQVLLARGVQREFVALVPGFAGIGSFLRGTALLATLPSLLRAGLLHGFDSCEVPVRCPPMPMYMVWHRRHHLDAMHRWLRDQLQAVVPDCLARADDALRTDPLSPPGTRARAAGGSPAARPGSAARRRSAAAKARSGG